MEPTLFFSSQYNLVKDSRKALLVYCKSLDRLDFTKEHQYFGHGGSIRNLLVHIVHGYEFWIERNAINKEFTHVPFDVVPDIEEAVKQFDRVDNMMEKFISKVHSGSRKTIVFTLGTRIGTIDPLDVFTHLVTHEFYHKGQILSLCKSLGYTPIDTGIVR